MRKKRWSVAVALAMGLLGASLVQAAGGKLPVGLYSASGPLNGQATSSTFDIAHVDGSRYRVTWSAKSGRESGRWTAEGSVHGARLIVDFNVNSSSGITGALRDIGGGSTRTIRASFDVGDSAIDVDFTDVTGAQRLIGSQSGRRVGAEDEADEEDDATDSGGSTSGDSAWDWGAPSASVDPDLAPDQDLAITQPAPGVVAIVGQVIDVIVDHPAAVIATEGPVRVGADRKLRVIGEGAFSLQAQLGGVAGPVVQGKAIQAEVTRVTVLDSLRIVDALSPHYQRPYRSTGPVRQEPAAILSSQRLRLEVEVRAWENLIPPPRLVLVGRDRRSGAVLTGEGELFNLSWGSRVTVQTAGRLNGAVAVNPLELEWSITSAADVSVQGFGDAAQAQVARSVSLATAATPLRIYTSYKAPVVNVTWGGGGDIKTKHHYEMACTWANGASRNIGAGADSIPWSVNNYVRHYVHPQDFGPTPPPVSFYGPNQAPPVNYQDLPSARRIENGVRPISPLYYPPFQPRVAYENYENFRANFGWWVLDNPTHTGGRCNQQAALVIDICGLLGIKGTVHFLQRIGFGARTGRPVRMYFNAPGDSSPWNFHGIVRIELESGSWFYDNSFSRPPHRHHGDQQTVERTGGDFIESWAYWLYDDVPWSEYVPQTDIPSTWSGVQ